MQTTYTEGKLYAAKMYDTNQTSMAGNEILSINGLPVKEISDQILPHLTADGYIRLYVVKWNELIKDEREERND